MFKWKTVNGNDIGFIDLMLCAYPIDTMLTYHFCNVNHDPTGVFDSLLSDSITGHTIRVSDEQGVGMIDVAALKHMDRPFGVSVENSFSLVFETEGDIMHYRLLTNNT